MKQLNINKKQLSALCQKHNVENLYIFGSVLTESFSQKSDIDFLVKFFPIDLFQYFNNYLSLKEGLAFFFGKEVDLIEEQSLKNPILIQNINRNKLQIYG